METQTSLAVPEDLVHRCFNNRSHAGVFMCGRCKVSLYCSGECQREHWLRGHMKKCGDFIPFLVPVDLLKRHGSMPRLVPVRPADLVTTMMAAMSIGAKEWTTCLETQEERDAYADFVRVNAAFFAENPTVKFSEDDLLQDLRRLVPRWKYWENAVRGRRDTASDKSKYTPIADTTEAAELLFYDFKHKAIAQEIEHENLGRIADRSYSAQIWRLYDKKEREEFLKKVRARANKNAARTEAERVRLEQEAAQADAAMQRGLEENDANVATLKRILEEGVVTDAEGDARGQKRRHVDASEPDERVAILNNLVAPLYQPAPAAPVAPVAPAAGRSDPRYPTADDAWNVRVHEHFLNPVFERWTNSAWNSQTAVQTQAVYKGHFPPAMPDFVLRAMERVRAKLLALQPKDFYAYAVAQLAAFFANSALALSFYDRDVVGIEDKLRIAWSCEGLKLKFNGPAVAHFRSARAKGVEHAAIDVFNERVDALAFSRPTKAVAVGGVRDALTALFSALLSTAASPCHAKLKCKLELPGDAYNASKILLNGRTTAFRLTPLTVALVDEVMGDKKLTDPFHYAPLNWLAPGDALSAPSIASSGTALFDNKVGARLLPVMRIKGAMAMAEHDAELAEMLRWYRLAAVEKKKKKSADEKRQKKLLAFY